MSETLETKLAEATARHRLLDHPFYRAWAEGTLTHDDLGYYSTQYWRQVEAFPGYLATLARRLEDGPAQAIVEENLADEVDGNHPQLWLDFAAGLGIDERSVRDSKARPETTECVERFAGAMKEASLPHALGMLYAYESQTPEVAATKIEGLRTHYGIDGEPVEYFALHGELDVEHSRALAEALERTLVTDADVDDALDGATAGAEAIYELLTGVARERKILSPA